MRTGGRGEIVRAAAARILDLRAEFEAQLRAVARLEQHLQRSESASDERWRHLDETVQRDLTELSTNDANIRTVMSELVKDVAKAVAGSQRPIV